MSGIVGVLRWDGAPASAEVIAAMSNTMAHRGPDACGQLCLGGVSLGHCMMWSTPESLHERQPLVHESADLYLVADARIDNRRELFAELGLVGLVSDAEIIIRAYSRWGDRCPEHLTGDFAFALWDGRQRRLFCARDHMGVRPLYYFRSERVFAFASEVKALLALPEVPRDIDPVQIALFVDGSVTDREATLYKAIRRLPAAHALTVDRQRFGQMPYWQLDLERELRFASSDDYAEAFREIFAESVRARLRSAYPVGAALSGGLDSSGVVCMARHLQRSAKGASLQAFSLVFPSLPDKDLKLIDERRYMDIVARAVDLQPTYVRGDNVSPAEGIDQVLEHLDEPYLAPNLYLHWALYKAANEGGARVFLDGLDGDTTVSHGFGRLNTFVRLGQWDAFEREVRATAANRQMRPDFILPHCGLPYLRLLARRGQWGVWVHAARELSRRFGLSRRQILLDSGLSPVIPAALRAVYRTIRRRDGQPSSLLRPVLARELRNSRYGGASELDLDCTLTERESHAEGLSQPAYQLTLEMADKCATAFSVEPRYPFFDRRLIEFCLAVPDAQKLDGGWPRLILRRAMEGILPPEVQWRSDKGNLSPNFHRAMRASRATAFDGDALEVLAPYVRIDALRDMSRAYRNETDTLSRSEQGHTLFRALVLSRWLLLNRNEKSTTRQLNVMAAPAAA